MPKDFFRLSLFRVLYLKDINKGRQIPQISTNMAKFVARAIGVDFLGPKNQNTKPRII